MSLRENMVTQVASASVPAGNLTLYIVGVPLQTWVLILSAIVLCLQGANWAVSLWRKFYGSKTDRTDRSGG